MGRDGIGLTALGAYEAPVLAALAGLLVLLVALLGARLLQRPVLGRAAGGLAVTAGWLLLFWRPSPWLLLWSPRPVERLAAVGLAGACAVLASPALPGRLVRWTPWLLAVFVGWWLAGPFAARPEYWRVWMAVAAATVLLLRLVGDDPARAAAAALGAWGALFAVGASGWAGAALVPAAAALGLLLGGIATMPVAASVAATAAAASLGAGQMARGAVSAVDVAALAPVLAVLVHPALTRRLARLGPGRAPVAACAGAAAIVAAAAWVGARALR